MTPSPAAARLPVEPTPAAGAAPRRHRATVVVIGLVLLVVAGLLTFPAVFGLGAVPGLLHLVSFRGWAVLAAGGVGVLVAVVAVLRRRHRDRGGWWVLAGVVLAVAAANAAVLGVRSLPTAAASPGPAPDGRPTVTVLEYNTEGGATTAAQIARLAAGAGADVIALPETGARMAERIAADPAVADRGYQVFTHQEQPINGSETSLLVARSMGPYRVLDTPTVGLGAVRVVPVDGSGPVLAAVHTAPPTEDFGYDVWERSVTAAAGLAVPGAVPGATSIVAGDFNATLDHQPLRDLGGAVDAARAAGAGAQGTWPSNWPALLGAPIDHVLFDPAAWSVSASHTVQLGGSDHRGLVVTLDAVDSGAQK